MEANEELTIADALSSLRVQLIDAIDRSETEDMRFVCTSIDVELQVSVSSARKADGRVGLWSVVTLGGGVDHTNASSHKVKLTLSPELRGRSGIKIRDEK